MKLNRRQRARAAAEGPSRVPQARRGCEPQRERTAITACTCGSLRSGGAGAAAAASSVVLSAGLDATVAVAKAVGKVFPIVPRVTQKVVGEDGRGFPAGCSGRSARYARWSRLRKSYNVRCRWQNMPYVKCMVNGLVALNGACDQAVHNKERCLSLSAYAAPSRGRATAFQFHSLPNAANAAGSKGCAWCSTESSIRTSREVRRALTCLACT